MNTRSCMRSLFLLLLVLSVLFSNLLCADAQELNEISSICSIGDDVYNMQSLEYAVMPMGDEEYTLEDVYYGMYYSTTNTVGSDYTWINFVDHYATLAPTYVQFRLTFKLPTSFKKGDEVDVKINFKEYDCAITSAVVYFTDTNFKWCGNGDATLIKVSGGRTLSANDIVMENANANTLVVNFTLNRTVEEFRLVPSIIDISYESANETKGLLGSIIEWIKSIYDGIVNLPSKIASSIKGFFDNVVNAVVNLGNFIIDGIKGLFVPDQEDITRMQHKWNTLLEDRFGALYQAIDIIHDYADSFQANSKGSIDMPSVSVPVAGSTFEFGGQTVRVVPSGFGFLFDALKLMISIISTFAFVNAMKHRLEKLVGGASNI